MAKPQIENGYTKIANEILEVVQHFKFTVNEMKLIMCIWRFTYGFQRKEHEMSLSFFEQHTGLTRGRVNKSLKDLKENNVIFVQKGNAKKSNSYSFNKNYDEWKKEKYASFTSVQDDTATSVQDDTATSVQDDTQERNIKENIKERYKEDDDNRATSGDVHSFYQNNFGVESPFQAEILNRWIDDLGADCVIVALKLALKQNVPRLSYAESIMKDWWNKNLRSIEQVSVYLKNKERKQKRVHKQNKPRDNVTELQRLKEKYFREKVQ